MAHTVREADKSQDLQDESARGRLRRAEDFPQPKPDRLETQEKPVSVSPKSAEGQQPSSKAMAQEGFLTWERSAFCSTQKVNRLDEAHPQRDSNGLYSVY